MSSVNKTGHLGEKEECNEGYSLPINPPTVKILSLLNYIIMHRSIWASVGSAYGNITGFEILRPNPTPFHTTPW